MNNQEIKDYIKKQLESSHSREDISNTLRNNGWGQEDIDLAFSEISKEAEGGESSVRDESSHEFTEMDKEFREKGKFGKSWLLVKASFKVLKMDKEIMLFPILSSIASVLVVISFAYPFYKLGNLEEGSTETSIAFYVVLFLFYLVNYFVITFFNVGLVACAQIRLSGGNPSFKDGINSALNHKGKIFIWSLVSATVGMILRLIAERSKLLGQIVVSIIGLAWTLATYFIVPVLIFENKGVGESIKESGSLFKKSWGENFISNISIGFVFFPLVLLGIIFPVAIAIIFQSIPVMIGAFFLTIAYFLFLGILSASVKGIFNVALYNYARNGRVSEYFGEEMMRGAFKPKKK